MPARAFLTEVLELAFFKQMVGTGSHLVPAMA